MQKNANLKFISRVLTAQIPNPTQKLRERLAVRTVLKLELFEFSSIFYIDTRATNGLEKVHFHLDAKVNVDLPVK
jgi:hypothetical protein